MMGRLLRSVDFERVLRTRSRAQSTHFALHHLGDRPSRPHKPAAKPRPGLSTGGPEDASAPVDDSSVPTPLAVATQSPPQKGAVWLGTVVPKRHAKRAVTRTLLKRQIRSVAGHRSEGLAGGLWVVRLRAPFDRAQFVSAASEALGAAARAELEQLFAATARRFVGG